MEKFERRQDERDERRHEEEVKAKAISFISQHYRNRGLIPLCAIAAMHNDRFYYERSMYREFCCLTREVQNRILEYSNLDLRVKDEPELFERCIQALEEIIQSHFPNDNSVFYDNGKYVLRSLTFYGRKPIPREDIPPLQSDNGCNSWPNESLCIPNSTYEGHIWSVLREAFEDRRISKPIALLQKECAFQSTSSEVNACKFATVLACQLEIIGGKDLDSHLSLGNPGAYDGETVDTMEDLFLETLFYIYIHLLL